MMALEVPCAQMRIARMWSFAPILYSEDRHVTSPRGSISGAEFVWQIVLQDIKVFDDIAGRVCAAAA